MSTVVSPVALSKLIRDIELINVNLVGVESSFNKEPEDGKAYKINMRNRFPYKINGTDLIVLCNYNVSFGDDELEDVGILKFKCVFSLHYNLKTLSECSENTLKYFADNNAKFNSWSFFRELLSNITMRMGIGHLVVPLLKPRPPERPSRALNK
jgi:hypothetical protein